MKLSATSIQRLQGVHPALVKVVEHAALVTEVDFVVTEGARTKERQRQLVAKGASQTMDSRHIPGADGLAKAVDLAAVVGGQVRWDWPLYYKLAAAMKLAAKEVGVPVEWGGDWVRFRDGPHFQLPAGLYP
jgi:peptidoglycan LD-endopeptidase CwlK